MSDYLDDAITVLDRARDLVDTCGLVQFRRGDVAVGFCPLGAVEATATGSAVAKSVAVSLMARCVSLPSVADAILLDVSGRAGSGVVVSVPPAWFAKPRTPAQVVALFGDTPGRTKAEVVDLFSRAMATVRGAYTPPPLESDPDIPDH